MRKFKVSIAKKKLHKLWADTIKSRDNYTCQWCFKKCSGSGLHAHHIVSRAICGNYGRFDIDNGVSLCFHCHIQRLKDFVDEYIDLRDEWLMNRGLSYITLKKKYTEKFPFTEEFYNQAKKSIESFEKPLLDL